MCTRGSPRATVVHLSVAINCANGMPQGGGNSRRTNFSSRRGGLDDGIISYQSRREGTKCTVAGVTRNIRDRRKFERPASRVQGRPFRSGTAPASVWITGVALETIYRYDILPRGSIVPYAILCNPSGRWVDNANQRPRCIARSRKRNFTRRNSEANSERYFVVVDVMCFPSPEV